MTNHSEQTRSFDHGHVDKAHLTGPSAFVTRIFGSRFMLYLSDYFCMKFDLGKRGKQLSKEHVVCRFCGEAIDLIGAWKCACGYKRPGNYFGRCPKCLKHPKYIDCPVCRFTMDVR